MCQILAKITENVNKTIEYSQNFKPRQLPVKNEIKENLFNSIF